ncbi:MAG: aspartyl protease family protein, partial [Pseudomonadota bacterium]
LMCQYMSQGNMYQYQFFGTLRRARAAVCALPFIILGMVGCETLPTPTPDADAALTTRQPAKPVFATKLLRRHGGRPTIEIFVEGRGPFNFIVDTAATQSGVFDNLREQLSLASSTERLANVFGITGTETRPTLTLENVAFGTGLLDLDAVLFDDWRGSDTTPQGIIGLDLLRTYIVIFDQEKEQLLLYDHQNAPDFDADEWQTTPIIEDGFGVTNTPLYTVRSNIRQDRFRMLLDTGADVSLGNFALLGRVVRDDIIVRLGVSPTRISDVFGDSTAIYQLSYEGLRSGDIVWGDGIMYSLEAQIFKDLGYNRRSFAIGGYDLLGRNTIAFDFRARQLYVLENPSPIAKPNR